MTLPHPELGEIRIEDVLHALADPVRLQMVRELDRVDAPVACGSVVLPISKSTRTHHLRILREAGVTSLRRDDLDALYPGLLNGILSAQR
jgi:DNA-binding transcriptional ArsR family regulator